MLISVSHATEINFYLRFHQAGCFFVVQSWFLVLSKKNKNCLPGGITPKIGIFITEMLTLIQTACSNKSTTRMWKHVIYTIVVLQELIKTDDYLLEALPYVSNIWFDFMIETRTNSY
jgi:hypothetical protein